MGVGSAEAESSSTTPEQLEPGQDLDTVLILDTIVLCHCAHSAPGQTCHCQASGLYVNPTGFPGAGILTWTILPWHVCVLTQQRAALRSPKHTSSLPHWVPVPLSAFA